MEKELRRFIPLGDTAAVKKLIKEKGLSREDLILILTTVKLRADPNEDIVAAGLSGLRMGLERKQQYLCDGVFPINLPKEIFLKEDIDQVDYLLSLL